MKIGARLENNDRIQLVVEVLTTTLSYGSETIDGYFGNLLDKGADTEDVLGANTAAAPGVADFTQA